MAEHSPESSDPSDYIERTRRAAESASSDPSSSMWDSDEAFDALQMERTVHGDEKPEELAVRMLREAAPGAAARIIHIAMHSQNDNTSLAASRYITDLVREADAEGEEYWMSVIGEAMAEKAEQFANGPQNPTPGQESA